MLNLYKAKPKTSLTGKTLTFSIDSSDYEVHGIGKHEQKIAFINGALPGEKVQAKVLEDKAGYIKADSVKVLQASPLRIAPPCVYAKQCGGCQLQHLSVENQRELKQQGISKLICHQTGLTSLPWQPMLSATDSGYRRRARIGIWYDKKQRRFSVGFRQHGDKHIIAVDSCMVLSPLLAPVFDALNQALVQLQDPTAVTHAEVLEAGGTAFVIVRHVKALTPAEQQHFVAAWPQAVWLGEADSGQFSYWNTVVTPQYHLQQQNLTLQFSPDDFIQVNAAINQQMVTQALDWLQPGSNDTVLDLYAGIGNFTLALAQRAKTVRALEGVAKMVHQLATNAKLNGLSNVEAYQADLHLTWPKERWNKAEYSKVLLDPARAGAQGAVEQIARLKPAQILYVSCNAATFARDAKVLLQRGYNLEKIGGVDMFAHTSHLELMALFSRS
ncbi:23S rRNA (uracil(1939)-C(5))-methyltransferase RlmD [Rheinheimera sp. YQF-2]|uniref:23S rRNA (Uracil(1939)-C(5))-methyltransferase RlmD n=1 Tax=Rheinheimera lutimaris TaxID=2740584 RepID=A0A7Y5EIZ3_9GAMM|nr:23S rRNA (uracil(1939)-C(5))-methyltransferase RlmD [Rheinheimera lutimaris]NRQ44009.1 23S rRNA (uracil(1939)-C(5))-methyltransferase RlmD [Rheinheimera lutimaris]